MNPAPPAGATLANVMAFSSAHESQIMIAGWMQAMGSVLMVLFAIRLVQAAERGWTLAGWLTLLSGVATVATSLTECGLYFAVVEAGRAGDGTALMTALSLIKGVQHVYLAVPVLLLPIGFTLVRTRFLPLPLAVSGLAIAAALQAIGLLGLIRPLQPVVDTILIVQGVWFLAASVGLCIQALRSNTPAASPQMMAVQA